MFRDRHDQDLAPFASASFRDLGARVVSEKKHFSAGPLPVIW